MKKQYKKRNLRSLGKYYTAHVEALTEENLHDKSDIAAELAWRDRRIATLQEDIERNENLLEDLEQAQRNILEMMQ